MIVEFNREDFENELANGKGVTLIDFNAIWCGPCQMLDEVLEELSEKENIGFKIASIDVDSEPELAQEYKLRSIPTMFILKDGQIVEKINGFKDGSEIEEIVGKYK